MRPRRLELEGFGAFRERTEIDFDALDLVAFVGPTGSGKSTVIDAMTFALYGSVARYDNTSLVAPVIHQLAAEARVRFDFELAGRSYIAVRVVRRAKASPGGAPRATTREARLERVEADGPTTVLAGTVSELDAAVGELIGLDFHQFTRTIVLPQGDFAEFLTDDPGNRQKLLRRLLDLEVYARMGARARDEAREAGQRIDLLTEELQRLASVTPEAVAEAEAEVERLTDFADGLDDRLVAIAEIEHELTTRRQEVTALDRSLEALAAIAVPDGLRTADAVTARALQNLDEARAVATRAQAQREAAADALDAAGDPHLLREALHRRRQREELVHALAALDHQVTEAEDAAADAGHRRTEAERVAAETDEVLGRARRNADAAHWVAQLVPGEACPICAQTVVEVPPQSGSDELSALARATASASAAADDAARSAARAEGRLQALVAEREGQRRRLEQVDLERESDPGDGPGVSEEALARATAAATEADESARALRHAETTLRSAQAELEGARKAESEFRNGFMIQRDGVVALGAPPPAGESLVDDWDELAAWAGDEFGQRTEERAAVAAGGKELAAAKAERLAELAADAAVVGVTGDPVAVRAAVAGARATAEAAVERLGADLARRRDLAARIDALADRRAVHDALGRQHLAAGGFERWLLAEALDHLVIDATGRLLELSGGRYSLEAVDGSFAVRDHANADERRDIRTLSGGEIFLASLSLALALSSSIADLAGDDGPRLESIFLDEGFGTLDVETLDVLAAAIEELSASGRLVAIVTHVRELAERMPVRFEVSKGATTSAIERVEV